MPGHLYMHLMCVQAYRVSSLAEAWQLAIIASADCCGAPPVPVSAALRHGEMLPVPVGVVQRRGCQKASQLPCCLYTWESLQPGGQDERCQSGCMPGNPTPGTSAA